MNGRSSDCTSAVLGGRRAEMMNGWQCFEREMLVNFI